MNKLFFIVMAIGFQITSACYAFTDKMEQEKKREIIFAGELQTGKTIIMPWDRDQYGNYPRVIELMYAINIGNQEEALKLIATMTPEELRGDYLRCIPLAFAIECDQLEVAMALIEKMNPADLGIRDMEMVTAYDKAVLKGYDDIAQAIKNRVG